MNIQARITFGFGIQLDKNGDRIPRGSAGSAIHDIKHKALELFGGFTIFNTEGGWRSPSGAVAIENGRSLVVCMDYEMQPPSEKTAEVRAMADFIKARLNQEAVFVSIEFVRTILI